MSISRFPSISIYSNLIDSKGHEVSRNDTVAKLTIEYIANIMKMNVA